MKTRKIELTLRIPHWWPQKHQWRAIWKTLLYKFRPDHCHVCKTRIDFNGTHFEGTVHGKRVMLTQYGTTLICGHCLAERIKQYYEHASLNIKKCNCCGEVKRVSAGIIDVNDRYNLGDEENLANKAVAKRLNLDVRYGMAWWNGFDLCQECICDMLSQNNAFSESALLWGEKIYPTNHRGAMITSKGKAI